jgi:hypothetical protein
MEEKPKEFEWDKESVGVRQADAQQPRIVDSSSFDLAASSAG